MSDGATRAATVVAAAAVVLLTGVVLANIPSTRSLRADHTLVSVIAGEAGWSLMLAVAAVAAAAGGLAWRRWAAANALVHAGAVALAWSVHAVPVGLQRATHVRLPAVAALGVLLCVSASPVRGWIGAGRRWGLGMIVLAAGLTMLAGVRPGTTTPPARSVVLVAVAFALFVGLADDARVAARSGLGVSALAVAALAGDLVRWRVDDLAGGGRLVARGAVIAAAVATLVHLLSRTESRRISVTD